MMANSVQSIQYTLYCIYIKHGSYYIVTKISYCDCDVYSNLSYHDTYHGINNIADGMIMCCSWADYIMRTAMMTCRRTEETEEEVTESRT